MERSMIEESLELNIYDDLVMSLGHAVLSVTGRPLLITNPDSFYNDNEVMEGVVLRILKLSQMRIPLLGHRHLDSEFIGEYPALHGIEEGTNRDYIFGVRPELNFSFNIVDASC